MRQLVVLAVLLSAGGAIGHLAAYKIAENRGRYPFSSPASVAHSATRSLSGASRPPRLAISEPDIAADHGS